MRQFQTFGELLKSIGIIKIKYGYNSDVEYASEQLSNFLACNGSNGEAFPQQTFELEFSRSRYHIGVTHKLNSYDDNYTYTYWIID